MKLEHRLQKRLELRVQPIPLLILEAKILELPALELEEAVINEVEANPMLDLPDSLEKSIDRMLKKAQDFPYEPELNAHPMGGYEEDTPSFEEVLESPPVSVWDRLEVQASAEFTDEKDRKIAMAILDNLDGKGFLSISEEELAEKTKEELEYVRKIRRCFMEFDPKGSGSLSITEFLLFQLLSRKLISEEEFEDFSKKLDEDKIREITHNLKISLLPYPFSLYEQSSTSYIIPEIIFRIVNQKIQVELYESPFTSLSINPVYEEMLKSDKTPKDIKRFLAKKYKSAQKFREALIKRKEYIRRIAEFIAQKQEEFLLGKAAFPVPVSQKDAALELDIPPSTLNRILKEKYADTPRGVFALRFFFKHGVRGTNFTLSQDELLDIIKEIIDSEDKAYPLSDEEITAILNQRGIKIKRRTVTQKRKKLGIPSSRERKIKR